MLHIESDSMAAPGDNDGPFGLDEPLPDDPNPGDLAPVDPDEMIVAKKFEPASILLKADLANYDVDEDIAFVHNLGKTEVAAHEATSVRNVSNDKWFWTIQTIAAYEPVVALDFDDEMKWLGGYAYNDAEDPTGNGAFIYLFTEVLRDINAFPGIPDVFKEITLTDRELLQRVLLHEIGHQMGGFWHPQEVLRSDQTRTDEGPMNPDNNLYKDEAANQFTPRQLGRIQSTPLPGVFGGEAMHLPGDPDNP